MYGHLITLPPRGRAAHWKGTFGKMRLILIRHGESDWGQRASRSRLYLADRVARRPGGLLLTAQGAPSIPPTLADVLEGPIPTWAQEGQGWDIDTTLDEAGFATVEKLDAFPKTTYLDIGAVVYALRAVPWTITDFTVERYREGLHRLHLQIKREGGFTVRDHHRLLEMRKPAGR